MQAKQDCELNAARRWVERWGQEYAPLGVSVLGDELYWHEPFCRALLAQGFEFLLVCKPQSHQALYEWVAFLERSGAVQILLVKRWTGKRHAIDPYRYVAAVPLREGDDALPVNWCELTTTTADGQLIYRKAFATSPAVDASTPTPAIHPSFARISTSSHVPSQ